jgi:hypothetical protein
VRALEIVEVLPLLELDIEELRVVHDDAVEEPVELVPVDAVSGAASGQRPAAASVPSRQCNASKSSWGRPWLK